MRREQKGPEVTKRAAAVSGEGGAVEGRAKARRNRRTAHPRGPRGCACDRRRERAWLSETYFILVGRTRIHVDEVRGGTVADSVSGKWWAGKAHFGARDRWSSPLPFARGMHTSFPLGSGAK